MTVICMANRAYASGLVLGNLIGFSTGLIAGWFWWKR